MPPIRKVGWAHVRDRRLLCARTGSRGLFYIPGGKPEQGEDDAAALVREIAEELAVRIDPATIAPCGTFTAPADGQPGRDVIVSLYTADWDGEPVASAEIEELRYLSSGDADLVSGAAKLILQELKAANVID
jgi:8-oxo-dGTP pyrophosphatase MutT (NUDIX family)